MLEMFSKSLQNSCYQGALVEITLPNFKLTLDLAKYVIQAVRPGVV